MSKCRFHRICKLYQAEAKTCNDDAEAKTYCGKYSTLRMYLEVKH